MEMNVLERFNLAKLLPQKGNILQQTIVRDIIEKVKLEQKDFERADITVTDTGFHYMPEKDFTIDVKFSNAEINLMDAEVDALDKKDEVPQDMLGLCLKIRSERAKMENKKKIPVPPEGEKKK